MSHSIEGVELMDGFNHIFGIMGKTDGFSPDYLKRDTKRRLLSIMVYKFMNDKIRFLDVASNLDKTRDNPQESEGNQ